jgi:hypothetical protein
MKHKLEDFVYDILYFFINNSTLHAILLIIISILISVYLLFPINPSLAYGFTSAVVLTSIYKFLK